jgi:hypothetical protein
VPVVALVLCAMLIASATAKNLVAGAVAVALGAVLFFGGRGRR